MSPVPLDETLLAYEHYWTQCHLCLACHHLWDVDKTRPPTTVN